MEFLKTVNIGYTINNKKINAIAYENICHIEKYRLRIAILRPVYSRVQLYNRIRESSFIQLYFAHNALKRSRIALRFFVIYASSSFTNFMAAMFGKYWLVFL